MSNPVIDLSIIVVAHNVRELVDECLSCVRESTDRLRKQILFVDNGSSDGTADMLEDKFPEVELIKSPENLGFIRANNLAYRGAQGRYVLMLNSDAFVGPETLQTFVDFMEGHPQVGICGPKVLNQDGSFQKQCRRGEPRPMAMFSYYFRLSSLFPKNRMFGGYLLEYEDEDKTLEVDALSGSCMLIRREVVDQIGYLDEQFYAYQEDTDYCTRARQVGWKVYYYPEAQVIHYGGRGGTRVEPYRSIVEWHRSYWRYYKKHLAKDYFFLFNWIYYMLIVAKLGVALVVNFFRRERYAGPKR